MRAILPGMARAGLLEANLADRMKRAVGFRNTVVHEYQAIDWHIVHGICRERLGEFRAFARAVSELLDRSPGRSA